MPEHPGEGMTASRDTRPAPHIHHTGDLHPQQNSHIVPPGPQPVCAGPDHGQDRSSSLRCGRSVLTYGPHPALPSQRPTTTKTTERTALTEPTPSDIPGAGLASSRLLILILVVVRPGGRLVIEGPGFEAHVQDADEPVRE